MYGLKPVPFIQRQHSNDSNPTELLRHAVRDAGGGQIAFDGSEGFAGELGAELVVGVAAEPGAEVFVCAAAAEVVTEQALDGDGTSVARQR